MPCAWWCSSYGASALGPTVLLTPTPPFQLLTPPSAASQQFNPGSHDDDDAEIKENADLGVGVVGGGGGVTLLAGEINNSANFV